MTITREVHTGFELEMLGAEGTVVGNATYGVLISNTNPKTGTWALRIGCTFTTSAFASYYWNLAASYQKRFGFHLRTGTPYNSSITRILRGEDGAGNELFRVQTDDGINYKVYVGATLVCTIPVAVNTYYHWGFDVKIDGSAGWIYVYRDGILVGYFNGNTGSAQIAKLLLGTYPAIGSDHWKQAEYAFYDDLTIDDTAGEGAAAPVPNRRYMYGGAVTPDGYYTDMTPSTGGDHFAMVDDNPHDSDSTYVSSGATGELDSYKRATFTQPLNAAIVAVIPVAVAKKGDSTDCELALGTRLSSTDLVGAGQALQTSYGLAVYERQVAKPGGGAWTEADINNAEIVIQSDGTFA